MNAFWSSWIWPALTAGLGFWFSWLVLKQYLERKKPHQLAWFVGLLFYAAAALMEAYSEFAGNWNPTVYRFYIVLAASLVGFLGLGSLYLVTKRRVWGHVFLVYNLLFFVLFLFGSLTAPLDMSQLVAGITVGGKALGPSGSFPRLYSLFFNIPGTIFLLGGAVWSVIRFLRKKEYAYRVWANVLIASGTMVIAAAGAVARTGNTAGLYPAEMVGVSLLLWGFLKAATLRTGAQAAVAGSRNAGVIPQDSPDLVLPAGPTQDV